MVCAMLDAKHGDDLAALFASLVELNTDVCAGLDGASVAAARLRRRRGRVERLVRTRFAFVTLAGIEPGRWRRLKRDEMSRLLASVDLPIAARGPGKKGERSWT